MDKDVVVLNKAIRAGTEKANDLNKLMGLKNLVIKDHHIVSVSPDGEETVLKKAKFGKISAKKRHYVIKGRK